MMKQYWKSLEELEKNPEFEAAVQKEFLHTPEELSVEVEADEKNGVSRREFLRLMGASMVMASAAACTRRPVEKIVPYLNKPEEITIGIPNWYASTCGECPAACGLLVKTREGRPIKLEGNNEHPLNLGKLCARGQASILNLYDPERLQGPMKKSNGTFKEATWDDADKTLQDILKDIQTRKGKVRILSGNIVSPTTKKVIQEFLDRFENGKHVVFEPLSLEDVSLAQAASFGEAVVPHYLVDKAKVIVSFGAEFLDTWLSPVEFTNRFSKNRKLKNGEMSRFVCFESISSLTGSNADLRVPLKAGDELKVALSLAHELVVAAKHSQYAFDAGIVSYLAPFSPQAVAKETGIDPQVIQNLADDLWQNQGRSLVLGGGYSSKGSDGFALQVVANFINSVLGNDGATIDAQNAPSLQAAGSYEELLQLIGEMANAQIDLLLIYKTNPSYVLPNTFKFEEALKRVPMVVSFADRLDETASQAHWMLPDNHYLESWGDAEPLKGLFSLFQPTIRPLYDTRPFQESLLKWSNVGEGNQASWHDTLKKFWQENIYARSGALAPFELFWESVLRDGVIDLRSNSNGHAPRPFNRTALLDLRITIHDPRSTDNQLKLVLFSTLPAYDGRSGNNSWLKELPDPVTKITWSNFLSIAPAKAKELKIRDGDVVSVKTKDFEAKAVVHIQPGQPKEVVSIPLGFGRTKAGEVGNDIGVNAFDFVSNDAGSVSFVNDVELTRTGEWMKLAKTQIHDHLHGRPIIQETTLAEYKKDPKAGNENPTALPSMWSKHKYEGYRWGMAIDLNACTGCSACVIACQAENNIPVVGSERIKQGREMHWIRIDRYYEGDENNPKVSHQPMLCQHCENAPCETVCPVLATVHDDEGLNLQIYNRCVGTRYCNNNCPYKVRRFNWFEYLRNTPTPLAMVLNPDVTVREKGVMEKCTFCHQRIQEGKNKAKDFGIDVKDGEIKPACQQTCPADAITFGNLNDAQSKVTKLAKSDRGYHVLAELNTVPSITYLTKVRNEG